MPFANLVANLVAHLVAPLVAHRVAHLAAHRQAPRAAAIASILASANKVLTGFTLSAIATKLITAPSVEVTIPVRPWTPVRVRVLARTVPRPSTLALAKRSLREPVKPATGRLATAGRSPR